MNGADDDPNRQPAGANRPASARKFHIHPPKPYMEFKGDATPDFRNWFARFERFLQLQDMQNSTPLSEREKILLFLNNLGDEGETRVQSHPTIQEQLESDQPSLQVVRSAAGEVFGDRFNEIASCHEFFQRHQQPGENLEEYITALRDKVVDCGFNAEVSNRLLAIVFSYGVTNKDVTKKLLAQREINIDRFLEIARAETRAVSDVQSILGSTPTEVHKVQKPPNATKQRAPQGQSSSQSGSFSPRCAGCGSSQHRYLDPKCPAVRAVCRHCGRTGHFEQNKAGYTICYQKKRGMPKVKTVIVSKTTEFPSPMYATLSVQVGSATKEISGEVDSGSPVTIFPRYLVDKEFTGQASISPASVQLASCDGTPLHGQCGEFAATFIGANSKCNTNVFVLEKTDSPLFGRDIIVPLGLLSINVNANSNLISQSKATEILAQFPNLQSEVIGTYPKRTHKIHLRPDAVPKVTKLRGVPYAQRDAVAKEVQSMVEQDIWEPAEHTDWVHGLVVVPKPNGDVRITTDLSPLNQYVVPYRYPLPNIKDLLVKLKKAKFYTKLDLKKAFFHIPLHPESRPLTATATHQGIMQYKKLPMGLKESTSVFQAAIQETLEGLDNVTAYQDDTIVYGATIEEHDKALQATLKRLSEHDFRLNVSKCEFEATKVKFLGYIVENGTTSPDPTKVSGILDLDIPKTLKDLQTFLGMANYLSEFIQDYSRIAKPLYGLTKKGVSFEWSDECNNAFSDIKRIVSSRLVNHIFDPELPTVRKHGG
jgi:hypothetical protein